MLHPKVYFIADKPSSKNISATTALVGTPSYATFLNWCAKMDIDVTKINIVNQSDNPFHANVHFMNTMVKKDLLKIVCLGSAAKKYAVDSGIEEFFILPHPSPANKASHKEEKLNPKLEQCRSYIYSET